MLTAQRVPQAPNHFIENGVVLKGERQRKVIRPKPSGEYVLTYQGKVVSIRLGIDNKVIDLDQEVKKKVYNEEQKVRFAKSVGLRCRRLGCPLKEYRAFLLKYKDCDNIHSYTLNEHEHILQEWVINHKEKKVNVSRLCRQRDVDANSYISHLRHNKISITSLNKKQHIEKIKGFKEANRIRHLAQTPLRLCKEKGLRLDSYRYFCDNHGFDYENQTILGHRIAIEAYEKSRAKRKKNNISLLCGEMLVNYQKYRSWLKNKNLKVSDFNREQHKEKINEFIKHLKAKNDK